MNDSHVKHNVFIEKMHDFHLFFPNVHFIVHYVMVSLASVNGSSKLSIFLFVHTSMSVINDSKQILQVLYYSYNVRGSNSVPPYPNLLLPSAILHNARSAVL